MRKQNTIPKKTTKPRGTFARPYRLSLVIFCTLAMFTTALLSASERENFRLLSSAYYLMENYYPLEVSKDYPPPKALIYNALDGMLDTLDPHTHFLNEQVYKYMREEQQGSFYGIGIRFSIQSGELTVISPIEGTPAHRQGIRAGDRIVKIEGESTKGITNSEVIAKLRGEKGTIVHITIQREGVDELLEFTIKRDEIPLYSVPYAFMLTEDIGYIHISNFASTTARELLNKYNELKGKGMKRLILDLRNNPGGLLSASKEVAELFLEPNMMIVYTRGRIPGSNMEFRAGRDAFKIKQPLVVLVNDFSASASEIVAGAIQSHNRGLIVGTTTFGKGLVQRVFPIGDTALQVTTAQYFTPDGKFIQKPFDEDLYQLKLQYQPPPSMNQDEDNESQIEGILKDLFKQMDTIKSSPDANLTAPPKIEEHTGGIVPHVTVKYKSSDPVIIDKLRNKTAFFDYAVRYVNTHEQIPQDLNVTAAIIEDFRAFALEKDIDFTAREFNNGTKAITKWIKKEIASVKYNSEAGYKVLLEDDNQLEEAIRLMPRAEAMLAGFHGNIASRQAN